MLKTEDILSLLTVILSLAPFIGVGFYFGRLEKRVTSLETKVLDHENFFKVTSIK